MCTLVRNDVEEVTLNREELSALVAEILAGMGEAPQVKAGPYKPENTGPQAGDEGGSAEDVSTIDLRKLYLTENPVSGTEFLKLKARTPARLGMGKAGPRYKTLTQLRFRADHAAAQDAVFSEVPQDFAGKHGLVPVQTKCKDKEEYLTRPDLGRGFDEKAKEVIKKSVPNPPRVQIVVGDGLSSAAILNNALDCMAAIQDGLKGRNIEVSQPLFVRYCRVGAGDAIGDVTGCELVCMLVGERPGLVTDKSMSAYITYKPRTGVLESSRTVVSNIHSQGTPAAEAGAHIAELIETILRKQVSGVGLHLEGAV